MVTTMPSPNTLTRVVTTVYLDADLLKGLQRVKERDGVPASEQIRRAIRAWLEEREALPGSLDKVGRRKSLRKK